MSFVAVSSSSSALVHPLHDDQSSPKALFEPFTCVECVLLCPEQALLPSHFYIFRSSHAFVRTHIVNFVFFYTRDENGKSVSLRVIDF